MSLYSRVFARYYDRFQTEYEEYVVPHKRELFEGVAGTFLELGPGTGANFRYLPAGCRWTGIEPNRHMHAALRKRAEQAGIVPEIHPIGLPGIGLADGAVDVVISTLVLCWRAAAAFHMGPWTTWIWVALATIAAPLKSQHARSALRRSLTLASIDFFFRRVIVFRPGE